MRIAIAIILIILSGTTLSCTSSQQAPTQDILATVEAMVEATKEADRAVSATVQAVLKEQNTRIPIATTPAILAATKATEIRGKRETTTADPPTTPESLAPPANISTQTAPTIPAATSPYVPPTLEPRRQAPTPTTVVPEPTLPPTSRPTLMPTVEPTPPPTPHPTLMPTPEPTPTLMPTPEPTPTPTTEPTPTPTPDSSPTAEEIIPEWLHENGADIVEKLLNLPWTSGRLTAAEATTLKHLAMNGWKRNALALVIETGLLEEPDPFAMDIIHRVEFFESAPEVSDPRQIQIEQRTVNLPLRGQTNLLILRAQPGSKAAMDLLENAVRSAEQFMDIPFPTDQVVLRFTSQNVTLGYAGSYMPPGYLGGMAQILPTYDQHSPGNEKRLAEIIAHEVSHYYWHHHRSWVDEGMAETMESYIENGRVGTPIALSRPACSAYQSIIELEIESPTRSEHSKFICNYTMGKSLFLDLRDVAGEEQFIKSVRQLYRTRTRPNIDAVKSAFANLEDATEVIERHYYGEADPLNVRTTEITSTPLTSARLHLEEEQILPPWNHYPPPLRSFSASEYYGPIFLMVTVPHEEQGALKHVTLTVNHEDSDWDEHRIIRISTASTSRHFIGPRRSPWLPGNYTASIEQDGKILDTVTWTVTQ